MDQNHLNVDRLARVLSEIFSEMYDADVKITFVPKNAIPLHVSENREGAA